VTSEVQCVEGNDERTLVLELSGGNTQVVVAEPAACKECARLIAVNVLTEKERLVMLGARPYSPACRD
jgi:hypothetical protein